MEAPTVARRTWALALAIIANVIWSYCVMHLGRFSADTITNPALWVALPCYAGYVVGALPFLLRPGLLGTLMRSQGWPITLAILMSLVSVMLAFSPIQTAFPTSLFVVLASFFSGLVCTVYKAFCYIPAIDLVSRGAFVSTLLVAHTVVYILSELLVNLHYSAVMLLVTFVLPVVFTTLCWYAIKGWKPRVPAASLGSRRSPRTMGVAVAAITCISVLCTLNDNLSGSSGWVVSLTSRAHTPSLPIIGLGTLIGCALTLVTIGRSSRPRLSMRYQVAFFIMLIAALLAMEGKTSGELGPGALLVLSPIFPRVVFWVLTYDLTRQGLLSAEKSYGWHIAVLHTVNILWTALTIAQDETPVASSLFFIAALALVACDPLRGPLDAPVKTSSPTGLSPSDALHGVCNQLCRAHGLSDREREVLFLMAQGYSRAYICNALVLSEGTVRSHAMHIYTKLGVHSANELAELVYGKPKAECVG